MMAFTEYKNLALDGSLSAVSQRITIRRLYVGLALLQKWGEGR